jgi:hypothetical protein
MISVYNANNFLVGLVSGITAATLIPLGAVFSIVFGTIGYVLLAVGVLEACIAALFLLRWRGRNERETAARISHGNARVVGAKHNWSTRVGGRHPVLLTVELAGGRHSRSLLVPPTLDWKPGESISVTFAPDDPANFVPVG